MRTFAAHAGSLLIREDPWSVKPTVAVAAESPQESLGTPGGTGAGGCAVPGSQA